MFQGLSIDWILHSATDAMLIADCEGHIVLVNPPAEKMFGYAPGELLGRTVETLLPNRFQRSHAALRQGYAEHPRARSMGSGMELFGQRCSGEEFPVEVSLSPLQTESGLSFMMATVYDITRRKQAEEALRQSQSELRRLSAHQEQLKEQERKRIAQEIHDELGALLTGIKAHVSVSMDRAARAGMPPDPLLTETLTLVDSAIATVRKVITDLRPSVLDQLGIWAALEWYAGQIEERSRLACECIIEPEAQEISFDQNRRTMLFRVVQEALTNVVRHAQASKATVRAAYRDGVVTIRVEDNGKGIDTERLLNRESWGLLGMYERTRHFGGELRITGTPGHGTTVVLNLPMENTHAA